MSVLLVGRAIIAVPRFLYNQSFEYMQEEAVREKATLVWKRYYGLFSREFFAPYGDCYRWQVPLSHCL